MIYYMNRNSHINKMGEIGMNKDIKITKACIIANMYRVLEILESDVDLTDYWSNHKVRSEVKNKMHEIRRDTKKLEKALKY